MSYPILTLKNQRKRTAFPLVDLVFDFIDWIVEKPERGIALGILTVFIGIGIAGASATLKKNRRV